MKKKVFSDEKKVEVLREAEQSGKSIQEVCRMVCPRKSPQYVKVVSEVKGLNIQGGKQC